MAFGIQAEAAELTAVPSLRRMPAVSFLSLQKHFDPIHELQRKERLHQIVIGTGSKTHNAVIRAVLGGYDNDGNPDILCLQHPAELEPIHTGHHNVHHRKIRLLLLPSRQKFFGIRKNSRLKSRLQKKSLNQLANIFFIIHQIDQLTHILSSCRNHNIA